VIGPLTAAEQLGRLRLARTDGVGPVTYRRLLSRYATAAEALDALPGLAKSGGRATPPMVPPASVAQREIDSVAKLGGRILVLGGPDYPPLLALLDAAPPVLGDVGALAARAVAMVGARNASANGQRVAEMLAADLALAGIVVVSGMARGIDAAAHAGALSTGRTVAAIASGIDITYPPENADLQRRVAKGGAVVTEAPFGTAPQARHFPRRNCVIAGLSLGVVVVEAAPQSGSLITARMAQDEGRELFAVPGSPLDPRCRGSNDLIRSGAHLTETAADVLANLPDHPSREGLARSPMFAHGPLPGLAEPPPEAVSPAPNPNAVRRRVMELLSYSPTAVDDLIRRCQFSASVVVTALLELELADRVEMLPGNQVVLVG